MRCAVIKSRRAKPFLDLSVFAPFAAAACACIAAQEPACFDVKKLMT